MQTHGGDAVEAAIEAPERSFRGLLLADWNGDGNYTHEFSDLSPYLESFTVDRSLSGSAPTEVLLIDGSAAAELSFVLGGDVNGVDLVQVFSEFSGAGPLNSGDIDPVGVEVVFGVGVHTATGVTYYPSFVGNIRTITPDRAANTVSFTALDRSEKLRRPVVFPPWAISKHHTAWGNVSSQLCDTQWVIDHCLRRCDVSPTPLRPFDNSDLWWIPGHPCKAQFWLSGTGSVLPTIGWMDNPQVQDYTNLDEDPSLVVYHPEGDVHPFVIDTPLTRPLNMASLGLDPGGFHKYWCLDRTLMKPQGSHFFGFTLVNKGEWADYYKTSSNQMVLEIFFDGEGCFRVNIDSGYLFVDRQRYFIDPEHIGASGIALPTADHIRVDIIWDNTYVSGSRVHVRVNGVDKGWQAVGSPWTLDSNNNARGLVTVRQKVGVQDVYYTTAFTHSPLSAESDWYGGRPARYAAVLDQGNNRMSYTPIRNNEDAWQIITAAAAADLGSVFWDERGVFRFWNYQRMRSLQSVIVRELDIGDVTGLQMTRSLDSVRNEITVTRSGKFSGWGGTVYSASDRDQYIVPPGQTREFPLWLSDVQMVEPKLLDAYTTDPDNIGLPVWTDDTTHGYVASYWADSVSGWYEQNRTGVEARVKYSADGHLVLTVWNPWGDYVRFTSNDDTPCMRVMGTKIQSGDDITTTLSDQGSIERYGARNLSVDGDWVQEYHNHNGLLTDLLGRVSSPTPTTQQITIPGDPRLQMGDCVRVHDANGFGVIILQIFGINMSYSPTDGLVSRLSVEVLPSSGHSKWDSPIVGLWDQTFKWGI